MQLLTHGSIVREAEVETEEKLKYIYTKIVLNYIYYGR